MYYNANTMFMSRQTLHKLMVRGGAEMKEKREIDIHIGKQIKKAREAAGYTQDRFAEMIQMGTKNVSAIERGAAGVSIAAIKRICKTLFISSDMLIMDWSGNIDDEKLQFLIDRMKHLSPQQFELALEINNKFLEIFALKNDQG